jgi:hypothetical protein
VGGVGCGCRSKGEASCYVGRDSTHWGLQLGMSASRYQVGSIQGSGWHQSSRAEVHVFVLPLLLSLLLLLLLHTAYWTTTRQTTPQADTTAHTTHHQPSIKRHLCPTAETEVCFRRQSHHLTAEWQLKHGAGAGLPPVGVEAASGSGLSLCGLLPVRLFVRCLLWPAQCSTRSSLCFYLNA